MIKGAKKSNQGDIRDVVVAAGKLPRHVLPEALEFSTAFFRKSQKNFNDGDWDTFMTDDGSGYAVPPALTFAQAMTLHAPVRRSVADVRTASCSPASHLLPAACTGGDS